MRTLYLIAFVLILSSCSSPLFISEKNIELYRIEVDQKVGYIDQKGKIRIEPQYESCGVLSYSSECTEDFDSKSFAIVKEQGLYTLIDWKNYLRQNRLRLFRKQWT